MLAIFFAWVVTRTDTPLKAFIEVALWLGFFLPLLPMTMGWILLLDPYYGLINKFLMKVFALSQPPFDIYSYWGIIWCHLAFSTSVRFLLMTPAFTAMDASTGGCRAYVRQQQHGSLSTHHRTDFSTRHSCLHGLGVHQEP